MAAALASAPAALFAAPRLLLPVDLGVSSDTFVELLGADGTPLLSTGQVGGAAPAVPAAAVQAAASHGSIIAVTNGTVPLRLYVRAWSRPDRSRRGYVVAGQALRVVESQLRGIHSFLVTAGVLCFLGALVANWFVAGRALRPLGEMAHAAEEIGSTGDLGRRLATRRRRDKVGLLTASFNGMLERLQGAQGRLAAALEAQRRFVADASHALRTPLTTIRSNASLLLQRPDVSAADRQEALADIAGESERMSRLVRALLTPARADAGQRLARAPLDLRPLALEVQRQAQTVYAERCFRLAAPEEVRLAGDADALRQLLWILLDNSARHTAAGGIITLALQQVAGQGRLTAVDDGPGKPAADLPRIFERFYRADGARSRAGAGLGLAIARWIVAEHAGRVGARNVAPHRAGFWVEFPLLLSP